MQFAIMPRLTRLGASGVLHHIIVRGIDRRRINSQPWWLGDSDFVTSILAEANEKLNRFYELQSQGYTIERVEKRVMGIFGVAKDVIYSKERRKIQVAARSLLRYWTVRKLG